MERASARRGRTPTISVRLEGELISHMDAVRDAERFPTRSDFIREAVRRMVREERRTRARERMKALAQDSEVMELGRWMASANSDDGGDRCEKGDIQDEA